MSGRIGMADRVRQGVANRSQNRQVVNPMTQTPQPAPSNRPAPRATAAPTLRPTGAVQPGKSPAPLPRIEFQPRGAAAHH